MKKIYIGAIIVIMLSGCGSTYKGMIDPRAKHTVSQSVIDGWNTRRFTTNMEKAYAGVINGLLDLGYAVKYTSKSDGVAQGVSLYNKNMQSTAVITIKKAPSYKNPETGKIYPKVSIKIILLMDDSANIPYADKQHRSKLQDSTQQHPYKKEYEKIFKRIDFQIYNRL